MSNTYTQLYIQLVFAVKYRECLITESFRDTLEKYICGIISNKNSKPIAIYCMPDHAHILIGLNPQIAISDLMREIKSSSSSFINERKLAPYTFRWQEGYGAFSYSQSEFSKVATYISNQPEHHKKYTFKEEYIELLKNLKVEYKTEYLFDWLEL